MGMLERKTPVRVVELYSMQWNLAWSRVVERAKGRRRRKERGDIIVIGR